MVEYPPGDPQEECAICGAPFEDEKADFASNYANLVCETCDEKAVTETEMQPEAGNEQPDRGSVVEKEDGTKVIQMPSVEGDNPVYIDGQKCWRRYKFGGWITRRDDYDCESIEEFHEKHREDF